FRAEQVDVDMRHLLKKGGKETAGGISDNDTGDFTDREPADDRGKGRRWQEHDTKLFPKSRRKNALFRAPTVARASRPCVRRDGSRNPNFPQALTAPSTGETPVPRGGSALLFAREKSESHGVSRIEVVLK